MMKGTVTISIDDYNDMVAAKKAIDANTIYVITEYGDNKPKLYYTAPDILKDITEKFNAVSGELNVAELKQTELMQEIAALKNTIRAIYSDKKLAKKIPDWALSTYELNKVVSILNDPS